MTTLILNEFCPTQSHQSKAPPQKNNKLMYFKSEYNKETI